MITNECEEQEQNFLLMLGDYGGVVGFSFLTVALEVNLYTATQQELTRQMLNPAN